MDNKIIIFITLLILTMSFVGGLYFYYSKKSEQNIPVESREISNTCDNCKCYNDSSKYSNGDNEYNRIQSKDNKTFCGKMVDNILYGCKENCCKDKCV